MRRLKNQSLWNFELGSQQKMKILLWIIVGFQQRDRQDTQVLNNGTFYKPPVTSAQSIIGSEKYLDSTFLLIKMMMIKIKVMIKLNML